MTKTRSVHQTAQSADRVVIHLMTRTIPTTVRKPRESQLYLAKPLLPQVRSASPLKQHPHPRSATGVVSMVRRRMNEKRNISAACSAPATLTRQFLSTGYVTSPPCSRSCLYHFHGPPFHWYRFSLYRYLRRVRHFIFFFGSSLRWSGSPPNHLTSIHTGL